MILARLWQVVVAVVVAGALAIAALTVAVVDRREARRAEELAVAQMQTVRRVIENDARRSVDALAIAAVNDDTQKSLAAYQQNAGGKEKDAVFRALTAAVEKIPSEVRGDAHVLVDREGTVVTYLAFRELDSASLVSFGAAPTVVDALHGYVRDDLWVLGGKLFRVVARPVEDDSSHPPLGAVLALTRLDGSYAQRVAERTGVSFAFFSAGQLAGKGAAQGFDAAHFDDAVSAFAGLAADEAFTTTGASKPAPIARNTVAIFSKLAGDAWDLDAGFVVLREQAPLVDFAGVFAAITDDDKKALPLPLLAGVAALFSLVGLALLWLEHDKPLKRFAEEAAAFQQGKAPRLQLPSLARPHRAIAEAINETIDRLAETTSAGPRRAADLQSIVGAPASSSGLSAFHVAKAPAPAAPPPPSPLSASGVNAGLFGSSQSAPIAPSSFSAPPPPPPPPPPPVRASAAPPRAPEPPPARPQFGDDDEENTMLAEQRSIGSSGTPAQLELAEWRAVYEEFVKTKQGCGESIEGLSFEKFQNTLRKNRDSIRERYQCERVKFTVYVKEGRASLKASPVRNEG
jgi:hypothetical protein